MPESRSGIYAMRDYGGAILVRPRAVPSRRDAQLMTLLTLLAITAVAAVAGNAASGDPPTFYARLDKSPWAPPAGVFGPVWTVLYAMMAIAAWLGVKEFGWRNSKGLIALYLAQLTVNVLWSVFFFGMHLGAVAVGTAITLCLAVVATAAALHRTRRAAGLLMLPYLAWVTFAAVLTWDLWQRNPSLL